MSGPAGYLPLDQRVALNSASPVEHQLMWAHADGAVAMMWICLALNAVRHPQGSSPHALRKAAAMLRRAAAHVDRAVVHSGKIAPHG
jgi:2-C-methyl-D-erythritol 4-phosphate cytidylyltransferase